MHIHYSNMHILHRSPPISAGTDTHAVRRHWTVSCHCDWWSGNYHRHTTSMWCSSETKRYCFGASGWIGKRQLRIARSKHTEFLQQRSGRKWERRKESGHYSGHHGLGWSGNTIKTQFLFISQAAFKSWILSDVWFMDFELDLRLTTKFYVFFFFISND